MIDPDLKRAIGRLTYGASIIACTSGGTTRGYTSTWVTQVSFAEPLVMISVSPKHDTYDLIRNEGWFTVSILAGDQIEEGQYFSYPGRRFKHLGDYFDDVDGSPVIRGCIAWLRCEIEQEIEMPDHRLLFARVTRVGEGRLTEPALTYSSRAGWRIADTPARTPGESVRTTLLERLAEHEADGGGPTA